MPWGSPGEYVCLQTSSVPGPRGLSLEGMVPWGQALWRLKGGSWLSEPLNLEGAAVLGSAETLKS